MDPPDDPPPITSIPATKGDRDRARRRWVTVEPVLVLIVVGNVSIGLVRPFFLKQRLGESLYNFTDPEEFSKCKGNVTIDDNIENDIQARASLWLLYLQIAVNIPVMISTMVLGTLSDRLGRKMCMAIPLIGYICQETVYIIAIYYKLPLPVLFIGEFLHGLTGGFGLLVSGCMSYITDISADKRRTVRIAVLEMLVFLVGGLVQIAIGYLIRDISPIPPLAISLGLTVFCLVYVAVPGLLIETVDRSNIPEDRKGMKAVGRSMIRLLKFNENGRRWQLLLLDFYVFFILSNTGGTMSIFILYGTAKPFCWTAVTTGIAGCYGFVTSALGMLLGTKLFLICLGDYWIMQISTLSLFLSNIIIAVATTTLVIFIGNTAGALRGMGVPVARSVISQMVDPEEIGSAFAIVACLESLSSFLSHLMAPSIYASSVSYMPQLTFYVFTGMCVIPVAIVLTLQLLWPQRKNRKVLINEDNEECYVEEINPITSIGVDQTNSIN